MIDEVIKKSTLTVVDRKTLTLDGVSSVVGFDSDYVCLSTYLGKLTVEGEELKIDSLTKETGTVVIIGKINGLYYSEEKPKSVFKGFFK